MYIENELVAAEMKQCIANNKEIQQKINSLEVVNLCYKPSQ